MARPLSRAFLLLFLLGSTAGAGRSDTCHLGPYGVPLLDASEDCSLHRAPRSHTSPGKTRAADPPATEGSRLWIRLGASAQEVRRSPTNSPGEQCNKWVDGQANPIETFHCPTQDNQREEMFCCGTCMASYCCSSTKERLDQASCPKVKAKDQKPVGRKIDVYSILELISILVAFSTSFILFFCFMRYWIECLKGRDTVDTASAAPDPPSSVPEEFQGSFELSPNLVRVPWGSGNRICEAPKPTVYVIGPLGIVPEEEEEEETVF